MSQEHEIPEAERIVIRPLAGQETIIRHGEAARAIEPVGVSIDGNINAPLAFAKVRTIIKEECFIHVDEVAGTIILRTDEHTTDKNGHRITGAVSLNKEMVAWGINAEKFYGIRDFIKHVKYRKSHFEYSDVQKTLLAACAKFSATLNANAEDATSKNKERKSFDKMVTHSLLESFCLKMPLYNGDAPQTFDVEILVDMRSEPSVYLESVELSELIESRRKEMIEAVITDPVFAGFTIIKK
jgi:hypothetical protein